MENPLQVMNLRKEYNDFLLDDISLALERGHIMGLIGPNGAGKTTTIRLLMNMIKKDGGDVRLFGLKYPQDEKAIKNRIGYVGEEPYFYQNRTIRWTEKFVSSFFTGWDSGVFASFVKKFDLPWKKKIKHFSKGMKVKLSFAIALSHHPELLILDEPTSGLDPVVRREILDLLLDLRNKRELSVFLSSHITDDLYRVSDRIAYMVNGRILITEVKDELMARWKRIIFKDGALSPEVETRLMQVEKQLFGSAGITNNYPQLAEALRDGMARGDVKVENVNLDDILISLVNGE